MTIKELFRKEKVTLEDLWDGYNPQMSEKICGIVGYCNVYPKNEWISCLGCPAYETYEIADQLLAVKLGLA